jgi:hypothetical protein
VCVRVRVYGFRPINIENIKHLYSVSNRCPAQSS